MKTGDTSIVACGLIALVFWPSLLSADSAWERSLPSKSIAAVAVLYPVNGSRVVGKVYFRSAGDSLVVQLELGGLQPDQHYRLQIHEYGDCSAQNAAGAGERFGKSAHLIEFPAGEDGWADLSFSHRGHDLSAGADSLLGRSVILHNEGEAAGCGTIGFARRREAPPHNPEDPD